MLRDAVSRRGRACVSRVYIEVGMCVEVGRSRGGVRLGLQVEAGMRVEVMGG